MNMFSKMIYMIYMSVQVLYFRCILQGKWTCLSMSIFSSWAIQQVFLSYFVLTARNIILSDLLMNA